MPVMEGKCVLFKAFVGVDAFPLCVRTKDVDDIVHIVSSLAGSFGGINLEDIAAPRCFEIERRLKEVCDIPVFHDDQHGTAIVAGAALLNAARFVGKKLENMTVAVNGAGAAGISVAKFLLKLGVGDVILCDKQGILAPGTPGMNEAQAEMARQTNCTGRMGLLADAMRGADAFFGVSAPGIVAEDMVRSMADRPVVFAMANPVPEIMPELALEAGAAVVGTGRSDYPNQINNVLVFPGIFRGALDVRASDINDAMQLAAAKAIAGLIGDEELCASYIIPEAFDKRVGRAVAEAVAQAAIASGIARKTI